MKKRNPKFSIIGAGKVGSTLALALHDKKFPIVSIISKSGKHAIDLAKKVHCKRASTKLLDVDPSTEYILIAVSDPSLEEVAFELSKIKQLKFKKLCVIHCSGVYSSDVLNPLKKKGATVASMHPIQTFPKTRTPEQMRSKLKNIFYGVEGNPQAIEKVEIIVRALEGKSVIISKELKPLYHVACVFASSYMATLLNTISDLSKTLNLKATWMEVFGPLLTATMENVVRDSTATAITGPIVRGDHQTIDLHLEALSRYAPQFLPLYTITGIEVARIVKNRGTIGQKEYDELIARFKTFVKSLPIKK